MKGKNWRRLRGLTVLGAERPFSQRVKLRVGYGVRAKQVSVLSSASRIIKGRVPARGVSFRGDLV